uniref:Zinc knuckle CX2CX4HX4C domain-containing protein n=1 Tax=Nelumbo nucifera TaxID=4432 RepID=A0A822ZCM3_NELNU|nr:TPA_asm: hypothetical protein HUJ06_015089 [Nelumbo nucifera]
MNISERILGLLTEYMPRAYAERLAMQIGEPVPLDEDDVKDSNVPKWDLYHRVKVRININTRLVKAVKRVRRDGGDKWLPVRYENLLIFCKLCGRVGHEKEKCKFMEQKDPIADLAEKFSLQTMTEAGIPKDYGRGLKTEDEEEELKLGSTER